MQGMSCRICYYTQAWSDVCHLSYYNLVTNYFNPVLLLKGPVWCVQTLDVVYDGHTDRLPGLCRYAYTRNLRGRLIPHPQYR